LQHSLTDLLVHVVFSTKNRQKDLGREVQDRLRIWMTAKIEELGGFPHAVGFGLEHAHLLVGLPSDQPVSTMVQRLKGASSHWLKREFPKLYGFAWQRGYGAFSVSRSNVEAVREYVLNQEERHRNMTFEQEYCSLLKRHEIEFDERHLWAG